ncbi:1-aminocyclopropane-1-carboxylate deaminase/D-cysteine desulfhydrase [Laceyella putida]|uniref:1-aminocyclopropane-1-carboxylate deaminase/D-cysteine desulfhydrase n=1 Tax=Laceyella putida TaxID=110101 RepID=A0ABW2RM00_9BACL
MKDVFPRFPLLSGDTPLTPLANLAAELGIASLWIKRDDVTELACGGNKLRKLEYLLGQARSEGCDVVITGGSPQSNHARLTVAAANKAGMETWLCFAGDRLGKVQGNLLLDQLLGAQLFVTGAYGSDGLLEVMRKKALEAKRQGKKPYIIPVGGSTGRGDYGYVVAWHELERQRQQLGLPPFDEIYVAVGTGGTLAGLVIGRGQTQTPTRLCGISVWQGKERAERDVNRFIRHICEEINLTMDADIESSYVLFDQYIGRKYGTPSPAGNEAIRRLARSEGILADPIYTGKAFAGMLDQLAKVGNKDKRVLFWHTGGTPALFTHAASFELV